MNDSLEKPTIMRIGHVLIHRGQARHPQIEFIAELQKNNRAQNRKVLIGTLLVEHRVVTQLALTEALAVQEEMPHESITLIMNSLKDLPSNLTKVLAG